MAYTKTNYVDGVTPLNAKNFNNNESGLDQVSKDVTSISQALVQVDDKVDGKSDIGHSHSELHSHSNKTVLDGVTSAKVNEWDNKSTFDGNYNSLTNKPTIPTVDVNKSYVDTELAKKSNTGHRHNASEIDGLGSGGDVDLTGYATETFVMDKLGGKRHVYLTQAEYDALGEAEKNDDTIVYGITDAQDKDVTDLKLTGSKLDLVNKDGVVIGNGVTLPASTGGSSVTVENVLTSTSTTNALAAAQGKVLDDKITVLSNKVDGLELGGNLTIRDVEDGEIFEIDNNTPTVNVTGITLNKPSTTVNVNSTETLVATISPTHATNKSVTWSSSNSSIATVSNGIVTGKANGSCTITATAVDGGFTATCTVTVQTQIISVESVSLKSSSTLKVGETEQLTATILPSNATNKNVAWSSSDESIAIVVNGLVTAKSEGSATITVTTEDGNKTSTCNLTIQAKGVIDTRAAYYDNGFMYLDTRYTETGSFSFRSTTSGGFVVFSITSTVLNAINKNVFSNYQNAFNGVIPFANGNLSQMESDSIVAPDLCYIVNSGNLMFLRIPKTDYDNASQNLGNALYNILKTKLPIECSNGVTESTITDEIINSISTISSVGEVNDMYKGFLNLPAGGLNGSNYVDGINSICGYYRSSVNTREMWFINATTRLNYIIEKDKIASNTVEELKQYLLKNRLVFYTAN